MTLNNDVLTLVLIILGAVLAIVGLMLIPIVVAARGRKDELATFAEQMLSGMLGFADKTLAPYGNSLKPIHDAIAVGETLVDEPSDWVIRILAERLKVEPQTVVESFAALFHGGLSLTDGLPPEEDIQPEHLTRSATDAVHPGGGS